MTKFHFTATANWSGLRQSYVIVAPTRGIAVDKLKAIAHDIR
jgi:hypothetical protein